MCLFICLLHQIQVYFPTLTRDTGVIFSAVSYPNTNMLQLVVDK